MKLACPRGREDHEQENLVLGLDNLALDLLQQSSGLVRVNLNDIELTWCPKFQLHSSFQPLNAAFCGPV